MLWEQWSKYFMSWQDRVFYSENVKHYIFQWMEMIFYCTMETIILFHFNASVDHFFQLNFIEIGKSKWFVKMFIARPSQIFGCLFYLFSDSKPQCIWYQAARCYHRWYWIAEKTTAWISYSIRVSIHYLLSKYFSIPVQTYTPLFKTWR